MNFEIGQIPKTKRIILYISMILCYLCIPIAILFSQQAITPPLIVVMSFCWHILSRPSKFNWNRQYRIAILALAVIFASTIVVMIKEDLLVGISTIVIGLCLIIKNYITLSEYKIMLKREKEKNNYVTINKKIRKRNIEKHCSKII